MENNELLEKLMANGIITSLVSGKDGQYLCNFDVDNMEKQCTIMVKGNNVLLGSDYKGIVVHYVLQKDEAKDDIKSISIYSYMQDSEEQPSHIVSVLTKDKKSGRPTVQIKNKANDTQLVAEYAQSVPFESDVISDYQIVADWFGAISTKNIKGFIRRAISVDRSVEKIESIVENKKTGEQKEIVLFDEDDRDNLPENVQQYIDYVDNCRIKDRKIKAKFEDELFK